MMKFTLALLAFVATSTAAPWKLPNVGRGELADELQDFLDLLPQDEIVSITLQYYTQDAEFQAMVRYLKSDDFKLLVKDIEDLPEMKALMEYMYNAGLDVYELQEMLNKWLGLVSRNFAADKQITGGIRGYVDDIRAAIRPVYNQLKALYETKMKTSKVFQDFITQLSSPNFQELVYKVYAHPKFQQLLQHAANAGIDLEVVREWLKMLLPIEFPF
ncbi:hypothetical protein PUN28_010056 [Cardiocondyla obscurior]|uniref:Protein G12 n=2 Tax=Cardiocondyla obscurior TaxID=286306 RepID=A0AAW2FS09_9HYME